MIFVSQRSFYYHCRRHSASRKFFVKEERRRLCLNCVKPVKTPQPELLDWSILFSLVKLVFECENPFIDKPMVITEPSVPIAPLGRHLYPSNKLTFSSQWLSQDRDRGGGGAGRAAAPPLFYAPAPTFCAKKKNN